MKEAKGVSCASRAPFVLIIVNSSSTVAPRRRDYRERSRLLMANNASRETAA